jgi:hypothetical protein
MTSSPFQPAVEVEIEHYECGDAVCHDSYGMGRVIGREAEAVKVDFGTTIVRVTSPFRKMMKL